MASMNLGYLFSKDAHNKTHRSGDLELAVTQQVAYIMGANGLLT